MIDDPMVLAHLDQRFAVMGDTLDALIHEARGMGISLTDSQTKYGVARTLLRSASAASDPDTFLRWLAELTATAILRLAAMPNASDPWRRSAAHFRVS